MKTLREKIEVMTAAANGAKIEWIAPNVPDDHWACCLTAHEDGYQWNWKDFDYRIAEPTIAPGHNPYGLTVEQVETNLGWRLLERDEIKSRSHTARQGSHIEMWLSHNTCWDPRAVGACPEYCYRTKLTREQLAALDKPAPKKRLPLGPEDFPPGTLIRDSLRPEYWTQVSSIHETGFYAYPFKTELSYVDEGLMKNYERSLDGGRTWLPCYKTT